MLMQFQVTYIEFDFDGEDELTPFEKDTITSQYIGEVWQADDEDDDQQDSDGADDAANEGDERGNAEVVISGE